MAVPDNINSFEDLSALYSTWVVKYASPAYEHPLYLVWYTDTDEDQTDRLLSFRTGQIFASESLNSFKEIILAEKSNLVVFDNLHGWLENFDIWEPVKFYTYDVRFIINSVDQEDFNLNFFGDFVNLVNMYGDYINQDSRNSYLQVYADDELIRQVWNYFYDNIFWPGYSNNNNDEPFDIPPLDIDISLLAIKVKELIKMIEYNIKIVS
ncbi:hypothetical protein [Dyadobacter sp. NIV53]|uniref:hypothetical protein n=1 Tax=Dyadobacter sp. NIV53 TaxID=2861765 RepID=UPI001C889192|nr:hypothetical protein [Dyadobacter sp. NIV53]